MSGAERAENDGEKEVRTHEVLEDDVPGEISGQRVDTEGTSCAARVPAFRSLFSAPLKTERQSHRRLCRMRN